MRFNWRLMLAVMALGICVCGGAQAQPGESVKTAECYGRHTLLAASGTAELEAKQEDLLKQIKEAEEKKQHLEELRDSSFTDPVTSQAAIGRISKVEKQIKDLRLQLSKVESELEKARKGAELKHLREVPATKPSAE